MFSVSALPRFRDCLLQRSIPEQLSSRNHGRSETRRGGRQTELNQQGNQEGRNSEDPFPGFFLSWVPHFLRNEGFFAPSPSGVFALTPFFLLHGCGGCVEMSHDMDLIYELPSIVEPLVWTALFPRPQPLEVELGCGDATFLAHYTGLHPERNFIGVERLLGRIRKLDRKGRRAGLTNLRGVRIESAYFLQYLAPPHSVAAMHVYFPDPWPKRKHVKNRMINERFPEIARRALGPGGVVYLRTDDRNYFEQMTAVFGATPAFRPVETPLELSALLTDFEEEFRKRGVQTLRAAFQLE
jgi:tRNA (guanine-N7-)-methyltransferase